MKKITLVAPCADCVKCAGGAKGAGRGSWIWILHTCTLGITLVIAHFMKCPRCGHTRFLNAHQPHGFGDQISGMGSRI